MGEPLTGPPLRPPRNCGSSPISSISEGQTFRSASRNARQNCAKESENFKRSPRGEALITCSGVSVIYSFGWGDVLFDNAQSTLYKAVRSLKLYLPTQLQSLTCSHLGWTPNECFDANHSRTVTPQRFSFPDNSNRPLVTLLSRCPGTQVSPGLLYSHVNLRVTARPRHDSLHSVECATRYIVVTYCICHNNAPSYCVYLSTVNVSTYTWHQSQINPYNKVVYNYSRRLEPHTCQYRFAVFCYH